MLSTSSSTIPGLGAAGLGSGAERRKVVLVAAAETQQRLLALLESTRRRTGPDVISIPSALNQVRGRYRAAAVANTTADAAASLLERRTSGEPLEAASNTQPVLLFTGQGSQYVGMGRSLYERHAPFRACLDECSDRFGPFLPKPLAAVMYSSDEDSEDIHSTLYAQPALFALEVALAKVWAAAGVKPCAIVGHSIGEIAGAHVAGVLDLPTAARLVGTRAQLMNALPRAGAMASVSAPWGSVSERIRALGLGLDIAAVNGRDSTVVSGPTPDVEILYADLETAGATCRRLTVSHAFHSSLMDPMLDTFEKDISVLRFEVPKLPLFSNVTGRSFSSSHPPDAAYYRAHVRGTVQFAACLDEADKLGSGVFLEVGPQPTLSSMARRHLGRGQRRWLSSLKPGDDAIESIVSSAAQLFERGVDVQWEHLTAA